MSGSNKKPYRLGLDMGTNSLGWAVIELDADGEPCGLIDAGARIYSDGRNPKDSSSLAKGRREARGQRRNRDRRLKRQQRLLNLLHEHDLLPKGENAINENRALNPYELRARAAGEVVVRKNKDGTTEKKAALERHELGRALLHLNQRRGFQSNRKTDLVDDIDVKKESGAIAKGSKELDSMLQASSAKTLGQLLYRRHKRGKVVRVRHAVGTGYNYYPLRAMYKREFKVIRKTNNSMISESAWDEIEETLFHQRRLRPVDPGQCTFNPKEKRALKALPISQKFGVYQDLANLQVIEENERPRPLEKDERGKLEDCLLHGTGLNKKGVLTWAKVKSVLGLHRSTRFNLEAVYDNEKGLPGDMTAYIMRLGSDASSSLWNQMDSKKQTTLVEKLYKEANFDEAKKLLSDAGYDADQADYLANRALPEGYRNLGITALEEIVPIMQGGVRYDEAAQKAGYHHSQFSKELRNELPYYGEVLERHAIGGDNNPDTKDMAKRYGRITNPTVHVGLNQLRIVVNAIIKKYGAPKSIVVELARELKASKKEKEKISNKQDENKKHNDRRRDEAEQILGRPPTGRDIRKRRLWEEQGDAPSHCCPFCGKNIGLKEVLSEATEIEHILPLSKTLDDSMANKVLAHASCNRKKGNRTPWEAAQAGAFSEDVILDCAQKLSMDNKKWRFYEDAMEQFEKRGGFLGRQLNETRHLSVRAREYLGTICKHESVSVTPGQLTALLRGKWGMHPDMVLKDTNDPEDEPGRGKDRTDHRHHAIDAFVVGMISRGLLQKVSTLAGKNYGINAPFANFPEPWEGFDRNAFNEQMRSIVVSHRVDRTPPGKPDDMPMGVDNTSGALFKDTAYGLAEKSDIKEKKINKREVLYRVPLDSLGKKDMKKDLAKIAHIPIREALLRLFDKAADKKDFFKRAKNPRELIAVGYRGAPGGVRSVRVRKMISGVMITHGKNQEHYKVYETRNNAFMDIFEHPTTKKWTNFCITLYDASQTRSIFEEVYQSLREENEIHPAAKRVMRLYKGDLVEFTSDYSKHYQAGCVCRVQKFSVGELTLIPANEANAAKRAADDNDKLEFLRVRSANDWSKCKAAGLRKARRNILGFKSNPAE